ncbi:Aste57867_20816 [Aphanomyces stellatus]|uniref:Aste57867_20816 protein n=1 Tax=Aphanomyces stellatus TaxID=120398 RepID=A0A485LGL9_9STRA|nr:hypothetical protein As57867_020748 [Aphanomyces stellatus]VFT97495.1 Aste57867_20816 [Aphanomyces stellatus]
MKTAASTTDAAAAEMQSTPSIAFPLRKIALALWPCALYLCCSLSMNIFTKTIITTYGWTSYYSLAAIQHLFTSVVLTAACAGGIFDMQSISWSFWWTSVVPMAALHALNGIVGFVCMSRVNMPMYLVLRRLTTFKVMLMEIFLLHKDIPDAMKASLLLTTVGSVVAGYNDATYDTSGYLLVLAQNCCTALSLVLAKKSNLAPLMLVYCNSVVGLVLTGPLALYMESHAVARFLVRLEDPVSFVVLFGVMSVVCLLYQVAIHLCTVRTSPLATSVTGNVKDLASTLAGYLLFADVRPTLLNVVGVAVSFLGAYAFSFVKYHMLFRPHSAVTQPWFDRRRAPLSLKPKAY